MVKRGCNDAKGRMAAHRGCVITEQPRIRLKDRRSGAHPRTIGLGQEPLPY